MNIAGTFAPTLSSRRGRPSPEQSERRRLELLAVALEHFEERGFEQATMETITLLANMSKRTVYKHYPDKLSLFHAAVRHAASLDVIDQASLEGARSDSFEQTLINLAMARYRQMASPVGLRLHRLLAREGMRLLPIRDALYASQSAFVAFLEEVIREQSVPGSTVYQHPRLAAELFMSMALSAPTRVLIFGAKFDEAELAERIRLSVRIFLEGAAAR